MATKQEVKRFLKNHRDLKFSAAKFEYTLFLYKDAEDKLFDLSNGVLSKFKDAEANHKQQIENAETAEEIVNLMRRSYPADERMVIVNKAIALEEETLPLIKKRALTSGLDIFIENTVKFFLRCKSNCCDWILENYRSFRSEYLKSMLCLVLGFRGDLSMIDFLIKEAERFEREYPDESFDQGPALAIQELSDRYLN